MKRMMLGRASYALVGIVLGGGVASTYGCGLVGDDCAELGDCGQVEPVAVADAIPAGWEGYYSLLVHPYDGDEPAMCADGANADTYYSDPEGELNCPECKCGAASSKSCAVRTLECAMGDVCGNVKEQDWVKITNENLDNCIDPVKLKSMNWCRLGYDLQDESGACDETSIYNENDRGAMWKFEHDACKVPSASISDEMQGVCIRRSDMDMKDCPDGWPKKISVYDNAVDERDCTECKCDKSACVGGFTVFDYSNCGAGGNGLKEITSKTCVAVDAQTDNGAVSVRAIPIKTPATCTSTGGEPTGSVVPINPVTFCCK